MLRAGLPGPSEFRSSFLNEPWIAQAFPTLDSVSAPMLGRHVVQFVHPQVAGEDLYHWQVWDEGRLASWEAGRKAETDVTIRLSLADTARWLFEKGTPESRFEIVDTEGATWAIPPSTTDLHRVHRRCVRGASVSVEIDVRDYPLGKCTATYNFIDGLPVSEEPSAVELRLVVALIDVMEYVLGCLSFREIARRTEASGDVFLLACLGGLLAPPTVFRDVGVGIEAARHAISAIINMDSLKPQIARLL